MIRLLPFQIADFTTLNSWIESPEVLMQFAGPDYSFPLTLDQLARSLDNKKIHPFKIIDETTGAMVGYAEIYLTEQNSAWLGKILIGEYTNRGKGLGQQIVRSLLKSCFVHFKVAGVALNVFDWNVNAIKCYERVGFTVNAGITKTRTVNEKTWTTLNMSISRANWEALQ